MHQEKKLTCCGGKANEQVFYVPGNTCEEANTSQSLAKLETNETWKNHIINNVQQKYRHVDHGVKQKVKTEYHSGDNIKEQMINTVGIKSLGTNKNEVCTLLKNDLSDIDRKSDDYTKNFGNSNLQCLSWQCNNFYKNKCKLFSFYLQAFIEQ